MIHNSPININETMLDKFFKDRRFRELVLPTCPLSNHVCLAKSNNPADRQTGFVSWFAMPSRYRIISTFARFTNDKGDILMSIPQ